VEWEDAKLHTGLADQTCMSVDLPSSSDEEWEDAKLHTRLADQLKPHNQGDVNKQVLHEFAPTSPYWRGVRSRERNEVYEKYTTHRTLKKPPAVMATRSKEYIQRKLLVPILGQKTCLNKDVLRKKKKRSRRRRLCTPCGLAYEKIYTRGFTLGGKHIILSVRVNRSTNTVLPSSESRPIDTGLTFCSFDADSLHTAIRFFSWETIVASLCVCGGDSFAFRCQRCLSENVNRYEKQVLFLAVAAFVVSVIFIDTERGRIRIHPDMEVAIEECLAGIRQPSKNPWFVAGRSEEDEVAGRPSGDIDWYAVRSRIEEREEHRISRRNQLLMRVQTRPQRRRKSKKSLKKKVRTKQVPTSTRTSLLQYKTQDGVSASPVSYLNNDDIMSVGARILCRLPEWGNDYFNGAIEQIDLGESTTYSVRLDNGGFHEGVERKHLSRIEIRKYEIGEIVEVKCKGWMKYYDGQIVRAAEKDRYDIHFPDGEKKTNISYERIRKKRAVPFFSPLAERLSPTRKAYTQFHVEKAKYLSTEELNRLIAEPTFIEASMRKGVDVRDLIPRSPSEFTDVPRPQMVYREHENRRALQPEEYAKLCSRHYEETRLLLLAKVLFEHECVGEETKASAGSSLRHAKNGPKRRGTLDEDQLKKMRSKLKAVAYTYGGVNWSKLFQLYDRDKSGSIEFDEFKRLLRRDAKISTAVLTDDEVGVIYDSIDVDGSGEMDYLEFERWVLGSESKVEMGDTPTIKKEQGKASPRHKSRAMGATERRRQVAILREEMTLSRKEEIQRKLTERDQKVHENAEEIKAKMAEQLRIKGTVKMQEIKQKQQLAQEMIEKRAADLAGKMHKKYNHAQELQDKLSNKLEYQRVDKRLRAQHRLENIERAKKERAYKLLKKRVALRPLPSKGRSSAMNKQTKLT
jgi:hypothetical protein